LIKIFEFRVRLLNSEYYNQRIIECESWEEYEKLLQDQNTHDFVVELERDISTRYNFGAKQSCDRVYTAMQNNKGCILYVTDLSRLLNVVFTKDELYNFEL
jgi:hypothetical protein